MNTIHLELNKTQLKSILLALSPFKGEGYIKMTFKRDSLVFEIEDIGNKGKIEISNSVVADEIVGISIFLERYVLSKLNTFADSVVKLTLHRDDEVWQLNVKLGDTELNIGLPLFDREIDTSFCIGKSTIVSSEMLVEGLNKTSCASFSAIDALGYVTLGSSLVAGTSISRAIYKTLFRDFEVSVSPNFVGYLHTLAKLGEDIEVALSKNGESVRFRVDNVEYITYNIGDVSDVNEEIAEVCQNKLIEFLAPAGKIQDVLAKLSIPLGGKNSEVKLSIIDKQLLIEAFDNQSRLSKGVVRLLSVSSSAKESITLPINYFNSILNAFNGDEVKICFYSDDDDKAATIIVVEDNTTKIVLMANVE